MVQIRWVQEEDREFWFQLDRHLPEREFARKVRDRMRYVLSDGDCPAALLRYNLFWDTIPFCTLLYVKDDMRKKGYGRALMLRWEEEMGSQGHQFLMTSTRADEDAQHFYRKLGYQDAGGLVLQLPGLSQPAELFLIKGI